jgi:hypothetical protein
VCEPCLFYLAQIAWGKTKKTSEEGTHHKSHRDCRSRYIYLGKNAFLLLDPSMFA